MGDDVIRAGADADKGELTRAIRAERSDVPVSRLPELLPRHWNVAEPKVKAA